MGSWKIYSRVKDANGDVKFTELKTHDCTKAELGLETESSDFYAPDFRDTEKILNSYADQFKCFDDLADLTFQGDSDSTTSRQIMIKFFFCEGSSNNCKTKSVAELEMNQHSFVLLSNQRALSNLNFQQESGNN